MTALTAPSIEIAYGPTHRAELEAFVGQEIGYGKWYSIGGSAYVTPHYSAYLLQDDRVVVIIEKVISDRVFILTDRAAYWQWERQHWGQFPDPETGRFPQKEAA
jgi:hypothetical protein